MSAPASKSGKVEKLRLAELLAALSMALDMTVGQPVGHCARSCWIGIHIGCQIGLGDGEISDLYCAILLKDLGCGSIAARICQLYPTDDITFKADFKQIDGSLPQRILALEPAKCVREVDDGYLDDIAAAFAKAIDSKSPFTSGHGERVTVFTDLISEQMGFCDERRRWLKRAALLHDIGKPGVSNSILDKPGKLNEEEFAAIRMHPVHSETVLANVAAFAEIAPVAGGHHERLDGKGYPRGLKGDEIGIDTRIVTVADIFDALTADRPYRPAMPVSKALSIMAEDVDSAIDAACFEALQAALERMEHDEAA